MVKKYITIILLTCTVISTQAQIKYTMPDFSWSAGAELNSAYLSRGMNNGGLALQPEISIGYAGVALTAWGSIGVENNAFQALAPEFDLQLSYSVFGFTLAVNQIYLCDGTKFFNFTNPTLEQFESNNHNTAQTELIFGYDFAELTNIPLTFEWVTYIAGDDHYIVENEQGKNLKRAYSTYIGVGYDWELPLGFTISPTIGITPWKSYYTLYEGDFAVNELSLQVTWGYEKVFKNDSRMLLDIYVLGMMNTFKLHPDNAFVHVHHRYDTQQLNGLIGVGIWFE